MYTDETIPRGVLPVLYLVDVVDLQHGVLPYSAVLRPRPVEEGYITYPGGYGDIQVKDGMWQVHLVAPRYIVRQATTWKP